jgi:hypothetical protein
MTRNMPSPDPPHVSAYRRLCRLEREHPPGQPDTPEIVAARAEFRASFDTTSVEAWEDVLADCTPITVNNARLRCRHQVDALLAAGWTFEGTDGGPPDGRLEPWAWSWRRPGKRAGRKGRRYPSTNQAYNALMRDPEGGTSWRGSSTTCGPGTG